MNRTKKLIIMLLAILALAACDNDEVTPAKVEDVDIYIAVNDWEEIDKGIIYSAAGDTIYITDDGCNIKQLAADGSDWFAVIVDDSRASHIIKNGQPLFSTNQGVYDISVENGNVYTLRYTSNNGSVEHEWVYKNQEQIYEIDCDEYFSVQMVVENGHVSLAPYYTSTPRYWQDGKYVDMQGLEGPLEDCFIDKEGDNVLVGINAVSTDLNGYWLNGQFHEFNDYDISIRRVKLVNGKVVLAGSVVTGQGIGGLSSAPFIMVDGKEYRPEPLGGNIGGYADRIIRYGNDFYVLSIGSLNQIFKNMEPIPLGYIEVKNEHLQDVYGERINLAELHQNIKDFIVLPERK